MDEVDRVDTVDGDSEHPKIERVYSFQAAFRSLILHFTTSTFTTSSPLPAAETGNMIARRYLMGEGTERDPEKAKEYYIKGVLQNDERSKRELDVLLAALRDKQADAESEQVELYCMKQLFIRHGAKFKDE